MTTDDTPNTPGAADSPTGPRPYLTAGSPTGPRPYFTANLLAEVAKHTWREMPHATTTGGEQLGGMLDEGGGERSFYLEGGRWGLGPTVSKDGRLGPFLMTRETFERIRAGGTAQLAPDADAFNVLASAHGALWRFAAVSENGFNVIQCSAHDGRGEEGA